MTEPQRLPDWEAFYRDYRKPGYIAGFEITTKLGGGMFGLVFRARRLSIGKDYAIKFLQVDDGEVQKAVLAELEQVKYFAQIDHPNLVSIEDRGEVDGIPFLVMAFAGTETLRDKIVAGEVPTGAAKDDLLRWFLQCCRGLAALHERSLVHFDIKPANVFLKGSVARLGDYGLSKLVTHSRGSLSMGRGTPYYMAPEMLQRRGDHRSDVYSLGVMLYELLCGVMPFTGDSEWEVLKKHESAQPELPSHLSAREVAVLQRCLQKDPAARFQSVHDLIAAFGGEARTVAGNERWSPPPVPVVPPRLAATVLPDCVVPPLPTSRVPVPPPLPAAAGRVAQRRERPVRRSALLPALLLTGLCVVLFLTVITPASMSPRPRPVVYTRAEAPPPLPVDAVASRSGPVADPVRRVSQQVDQLVQGVLRSARNAAQRELRPQLRPFDPTRFGAPDDQAQCRERVDKLVKVTPFSKGQAAKLAQLGRPVLLAAVEGLQQLDYESERDRRRATNLQRLLAQLTTIDDLVIDVDAAAVCEGDICRFHVIADGWRQLAERFAGSDAAFVQLLAAKGLVPGSDR